MLRSTLVSAVLFVSTLAGAQPARETLLRDIRHDEDHVRPTFVTLTAGKVKAKTTAALLEVDDGDTIVQSVEVEFPKGDNVQYALVEFEPPDVRDSRGNAVAIERQNGMLNETRASVEHKLLAPGGLEPARFATVKGRVTVEVPLSIETRTIRPGDRDRLAELGAVIDGPFVHYQRELPGSISWLSDLKPVRAYDAEGKALEREGTYFESPMGEDFHVAAFYGSPATVEIDIPGETATVIIDYDLTYGDRKASKATTRLDGDEPETAAADPIDNAAALAQLQSLNYPSIDADQLMAAAANDDTKAVSLLLGAGVPVDARGASGRTALHVAFATDSDKVVDLLLASGADVNARDANGLTPLFGLAADCDKSATIAMLVEKGADVNIKGKSALSPLGLAKAMNCNATVEILTKAGAR